VAWILRPQLNPDGWKAVSDKFDFFFFLQQPQREKYTTPDVLFFPICFQGSQVFDKTARDSKWRSRRR
jgi:hypothetical protein